jgi:hypothetical protein
LALGAGRLELVAEVPANLLVGSTDEEDGFDHSDEDVEKTIATRGISPRRLP